MTKKTVRLISLVGLMASAALADGANVADPTRAADRMADVLRQQLTGADSMKLHALVVGGDGEGVALLGATPQSAFAVRRGTTFAETVDGVKVEVTIRKVSSLGVELETSSTNRPVFLPGSFRALPMPSEPTAEFISYIEANEVPLSRLVRLISDQTGVNISSSDATSARNVSIFLRNVTADAAVEEICRTCGLWYRRDPKGGVVRITTMDEYSESLNTFREESTETFTLLYPNVIEVASVIYGLYPDRTLLSLGEEEFQEDDEYDLSRRFRRFQVIEDNGNSQFMSMQSPRTSGGNSGNSGSGTFSFSRGDALSRLQQWEQLSPRYRRNYLFGGRNALSADEAKFIDAAALSGNTNLVDFAMGRTSLATANIFVTISRKNNKLIVRTSDVKVMDEIRRLVKDMDVPTPMVLMELKILELDVSDDFAAGFNWGLSEVVTTERSGSLTTDSDTGEQTYTYNTSSTRINGIQAGSLAKGASSTDAVGTFNKSGTLTDGSITRTYSSAANLMANLSQGGAKVSNPTFAFSILSDRIASSLELMQQDGKVKVLSTPTLLSVNNEVSRIFSGSEYPIVTGWTQGDTATTDGVVVQNTPTAEIEQKDVGTMLLITPNINSDKTVTIRLLQENSSIAAEKAEIPVDGASGATKAIDYIESRTLTGTFVAKDGMSVVAGGLIRESEENVYWRTPFLGSIPFFGWFFRGTEKAKRRTELIVLITPHVISTPMEGGKISEELLKRISAHPVAHGEENLKILQEDDGKMKEHTIKEDIMNLVQ